MIRVDAVWLATAPVDMRAGADRLLANVVQVFGAARPTTAKNFTSAAGCPDKLSSRQTRPRSSARVSRAHRPRQAGLSRIQIDLDAARTCGSICAVSGNEGCRDFATGSWLIRLAA